ncbi:MAG: CTP synthase C-terminal region-related (seleno)protein [Burkholderiaceae bacterium]
MTRPTRIAIVGDRDDAIAAHRAIPIALADVAAAHDLDLAVDWLATDAVGDGRALARFDGLWCAPGSPYRSEDGALRAIAHARTTATPFLGTCGGFQHALLEFARAVLGWDDATHAESEPGVGRAVIAPLECALVEASGFARLAPGSRIAKAYGAATAPTIYRCRYGLAPEFRAALTAGPLRATAEDERGELRTIELDDHPFFVATLWQPERAALALQPVPLAQAFAAAAHAHAAAR